MWYYEYLKLQLGVYQSYQNRGLSLAETWTWFYLIAVVPTVINTITGCRTFNTSFVAACKLIMFTWIIWCYNRKTHNLFIIENGDKIETFNQPYFVYDIWIILLVALDGWNCSRSLKYWHNRPPYPSLQMHWGTPCLTKHIPSFWQSNSLSWQGWTSPL